MRVSLLGLIRMTGLAALALTSVAVGLGRLFPEEAAYRRLQPTAPLQLVRGATDSADPRFVDPADGSIVHMALPQGSRLECARAAPWRDERGRTQVVGLWFQREPEQGFEGDRVTQVGIARFSYPDGEPLDVIETEATPSGPPCWIPGTPARVLYAANDGALYRVDFELDGRRAGVGPEPVKLTWPERPEALRGALIRDPYQPVEPALHDTLVVSLVRGVERDGHQTRASQLWWIRLNADRTTIVAAGPLLEAPLDAAAPLRRYPVVVSGGRGMRHLVWLERRPPTSGWTLKAASLILDSEGSPRCEIDSSTDLADGLAPMTPLAAAGGRDLFLQVGGETPTVRRVAISGEAVHGRRTID